MLKTTVWYFLALLKHWSRLFAPSLCHMKWLHEVEREELSFVFSQINQFSSVKLSWALLSELSDSKMGQSGSRGVKVQGKVWIWQNHLLEWSKPVKAKGTLYFGRDESVIGIPRGFPSVNPCGHFWFHALKVAPGYESVKKIFQENFEYCRQNYDDDELDERLMRIWWWWWWGDGGE